MVLLGIEIMPRIILCIAAILQLTVLTITRYVIALAAERYVYCSVPPKIVASAAFTFSTGQVFEVVALLVVVFYGVLWALGMDAKRCLLVCILSTCVCVLICLTLAVAAWLPLVTVHIQNA